MILESFRIQNFRSIVDTGWCQFSHDNVTVLIGQNESGKTSVLEAISKTFSDNDISDDDTRTGADLPRISVKVKIDKVNFFNYFQDYTNEEKSRADKILKKINYNIEIEFYWTKNADDEFEKGYVIISDDSIISELDNQKEIKQELQSTADISVEVVNETSEEEKQIDSASVAQFIYDEAPVVVLFNKATGILPDKIDIKDSEKLDTKTGMTAANNFLSVAKIDLKSLLSEANRRQETILNKANEKISQEFSDFWTQTIGKSNNKISIACKLERHDATVPEKAGKEYLTFYIYDGGERLHLRQRSEGVKWFFSFFLQLKAIENNPDKIFLLDEPGSNLHIKAQKDVLNLMNKISAKVPLIYSTHSPDMVEYDKIYRILAVERGEVEDTESPTIIKTATQLSSASEDTLSPLLKCMGANFYNQNVIQKRNNVLLEEISGFYYLKAFYKLLNKDFEVHFIPCNGVTTVTKFANMFLGWGLDFITVVDDDGSARSVYKDLKKNLYGDNEEVAKKNVYKIENCSGIEDLFESVDFTKLILKNNQIKINGKISEHMKQSGISKPLVSSLFMKEVMDGVIKIGDLHANTVDRVTSIVAIIEGMLSKR